MQQLDDCIRVRYLVVVPTKNEVKAIGYVLDEILSVGVPREDIVVIEWEVD